MSQDGVQTCVSIEMHWLDNVRISGEIHLLMFLRDQILTSLSDLRQAFENTKLTNIPRNLFTEIIDHVQGLKDRIERIIEIGDRSQIV